MKVSLVAVTPNAESHIVYIARISSKRENKQEKPAGLLNYLIKHKHWSPFEHAYMTVEIETSKSIGIQLIRHRSFNFQEFSQRYQDVTLLGEIFEKIELRQQAEDNRQSSTLVIEDMELSNKINAHLLASKELYKELIQKGIAREVARFILPMATKTRIHMTGSIRSWIHFLELRDDQHAQKEMQLLAQEIKKIFILQFPIIATALAYS